MAFDLSVIGRHAKLFEKDLEAYEQNLKEEIRNSRILVLGAGGSIGRAVCKEIFKRSPSVLHAVDISENSLAELVRDLKALLDILMASLPLV